MKKLLSIFVAASLTLGVASIAPAQTEDSAAAVSAPKPADGKVKEKMGKLETIECVGTLQVTPPDAAKKQKYSNVVLKDGDKEYKLLPGKEIKNFAELEKLSGKVISVSGVLLPANDKHPMAAIKVNSFKEVAPPTADELKK